jgi:hypothetical protein
MLDDRACIARPTLTTETLDITNVPMMNRPFGKRALCRWGGQLQSLA